jgi:SAM-dependent methyltransferase
MNVQAVKHASVVAGPSTRAVVNVAYRSLQAAHVLPSPWMMKSALKVYEFRRVFEGCHIAVEDDILDLGCGKGFHTQVLARHCRSALGLDVSGEQVRLANEFLAGSTVSRKTRFLCSTLEGAGLLPNSFDKLFSFCVLEHIPNLDEVLMKAWELLKPSGELHVSVDSLEPFRNTPLIEKHKHDHYVCRYFTVTSLRSTLTNAGFLVEQIFPILTGPKGRREFEQRISTTHPHSGLVERMLKVYAFDREDRSLRASAGIMLVARARRPTA